VLPGAAPGANLEKRVHNDEITQHELVFSALSVALLATPAIAGNTHSQTQGQRTTLIDDSASDDVDVHDRVDGRDPDLRIRGELSRDADSLHGE
jgi:hypothetical protein